MVELTDLVFRYPRSSFELVIEKEQIASGEKVAIVGPSGSGKTTFLNLISGISVPLSGQVSVDSEMVSQKSDVARRDFRISKIGFVFQQFELVDYLTVVENIQLPYLINPSLKLDRAVNQRAVELANEVGIGDKLNRRVPSLSQGEKQRVAICRAMLPRPPLILADEPTGNLDPANKARILELLFQQCKSYEMTLLAVTHDQNIVGGFDRTIDFENFHREQAA